MDLSVENCIELLQDRFYVTRVAAAEVLGRMGPELEPVLPILLATLEEPCSGLRDVAADALGAIGGRGRGAIPALHAAMASRNRFVRSAAQRALERIENADN